MARKKRESRHYKPMDEFRYNYSPTAAGHPDYVFGKKNGKFKSVGLTHNPKKKHKTVELTKNPNPLDNRTAHIQLAVRNTQERYFSSPLSDWEFSQEDKAIARHIKKQHKKRQNKKR